MFTWHATEACDPRIQPLNAMDCVIAAMDADLRAEGHAGILVQCQIWLHGRIADGELQSVVDKFARRFPVIAARLGQMSTNAALSWRFGAASTSRVRVHKLSDVRDDAVWRLAEELLATPVDPRLEEPVQFHLLHRPRNTDVLILQWVHPLMDGKAGELALVALNHIYAGQGLNDPNPQPAEDDEYRHLLAQVPWRHRLQGYWALWTTTRHHARPLTLRRSCESPRDGAPVRIAVRALDESSTSEVFSRSRRLLGFDNLSALVLASAFRAMRSVVASADPRSVCYTHVPITLRSAGDRGAIFHNRSTYLPVRTTLNELADRDQLTRSVNAQFRDGLRRHIDRAYLKGLIVLSGQPARAARRYARLARETSFVYGYHGPVAAGLETFCGQPVDRVYSGIASAWSPPGVTVSASQWRRCLHVMVTHVPRAVSPDVVDRFLDVLVDDLASPVAYSRERIVSEKALLVS